MPASKVVVRISLRVVHVQPRCISSFTILCFALLISSDLILYLYSAKHFVLTIPYP
jgi:hypothetical protein